ncbi:Cupredoxin [Microthyrium microscopicum]|uniref:Cupredoxin n=1 Tax=Microthyrium microscopicum TaxID=703497 RepID=A0A6A6UE21_9PEZI|nr:Cupredoxin [Microthyrium microscopicum]
MKLTHILSVLPLAFAQYNYGSTTAQSSSTATAASSTSAASGSVATVAVGQNGFTFSPDTLTAAVGSRIVFQIYPGDHSVTQGDFSTPCQSNSTGFNSGFINSNSGPAAQAFTITVNSTDPIWFYCAQVTHCQSGMVGVINPPSSGQSLSDYKSAAAKSSGSSKPANVQGGVLGSPPASGSSASASPTPKGETAKNHIQWAGALLGVVMTAYLLL